MKITSTFFTSILTCCVILFCVGCTEENYYFNTTPKDKSSYTIMLYGCGGGNLDSELMLNLNEAIAENVDDRIQFTGQVKFSKQWQEENPEVRGTLRFSLKDVVDGKIVPNEVFSSSLPLYDPQTLADFITWSKKTAPADEYILVLWNHGNGWFPKSDKEKMRGICFDDNLDMAALSLDELVEGVKRSKTHFKMIYYDACQMAVIENYAGVAEVADYALGGSHNTPSIGGDYSSLIYNLKHSTNFEESIKRYCDDVIRHWNISSSSFNLSLCKLSHITEVCEGAAMLSETLNEIMLVDSTSSEYDSWLVFTIELALKYCYRYSEQSPYFDLSDFAERLAYEVEDDKYAPIFIRAASTISRALSDFVIYNRQTSVVESDNLTLGVTIVNKDEWAENGYEGVYQKLAFDRYSQWSSWLKINTIKIEVDTDDDDDDYE